jgi:hypothetical protein
MGSEVEVLRASHWNQEEDVSIERYSENSIKLYLREATYHRKTNHNASCKAINVREDSGIAVHQQQRQANTNHRDQKQHHNGKKLYL